MLYTLFVAYNIWTGLETDTLSAQISINIWETVLGESDVNDKKARINGKVTESIYQNLIEAAIFKEDFVRAQDFLVLFGEMDLKKSEVSWVNSRTAFIEKRLGN